MTKEELERIKAAYYSGLKVQIWFNGNWEDFDARDYSMYKDPFSENRQYRIVGSDYAEKAEKRIAELERKLKVETELSNRLGLAYREYEQLTKEQDEHLAELEQENAELKARLNEQSERITELTQELDDKINRFG
jgi:predicted RNase H-like nuclease (RuvC/YqgF family)